MVTCKSKSQNSQDYQGAIPLFLLGLSDVSLLHYTAVSPQLQEELLRYIRDHIRAGGGE